MSIILKNSIITGRTPYYKRMIRCPGHYLIPPTVDVYLREPVQLLKNCSKFVEIKGKKITIKKERIVRDRFGNKKIDWKKLHELRRKGIVLHPDVSAAWAIEHVYDPQSILCFKCPKYCKEGQGRVLITSIKRLMGIPIKNRR